MGGKGEKGERGLVRKEREPEEEREEASLWGAGAGAGAEEGGGEAASLESGRMCARERDADVAETDEANTCFSAA